MQIIDNSGVRLMNVHGANKDCRTSLCCKLNRSVSEQLFFTGARNNIMTTDSPHIHININSKCSSESV